MKTDTQCKVHLQSDRAEPKGVSRRGGSPSGAVTQAWAAKREVFEKFSDRSGRSDHAERLSREQRVSFRPGRGRPSSAPCL